MRRLEAAAIVAVTRAHAPTPERTRSVGCPSRELPLHRTYPPPGAEARPARPSAAKRKAKSAVRATVAEVTISHPQRRFQNSGKLTKLDLARYYEAVSDWLRPHLAKRPLALVRCPGGDFGACFFQRHGQPGLESEKPVPKDADYLLAESSRGG